MISRVVSAARVALAEVLLAFGEQREVRDQLGCLSNEEIDRLVR